MTLRSLNWREKKCEYFTKKKIEKNLEEKSGEKTRNRNLTLVLVDGGGGETTLGIVEETEVVVGLVNVDDIHETSGVVEVGADLTVNLDEPLLADEKGLLPGQGVLETVPQEDNQRETLPELVGTGRGMGSLKAKRRGSGKKRKENTRKRRKEKEKERDKRRLIVFHQ